MADSPPSLLRTRSTETGQRGLPDGVRPGCRVEDAVGQLLGRIETVLSSHSAGQSWVVLKVGPFGLAGRVVVPLGGAELTGRSIRLPLLKEKVDEYITR